MYARYPNYRFGGGIKIPENYSGNAFSASPTDPDVPPDLANTELQEVSEDIPVVTVDKNEENTETSIFRGGDKRRRASPFGFRFDLGRLFSGGFGFEELLILAIILLVSQNEAQDDLILFLAILLFVG